MQNAIRTTAKIDHDESTGRERAEVPSIRMRSDTIRRVRHRSFDGTLKFRPHGTSLNNDDRSGDGTLACAERLAERTRIARDFHDTLLQSVHGVLLGLQAVTLLLPDRPAEALQSLGSAIDLARQAITEGRNALQGLRSSTHARADLPYAIETIAERLLAGRGDRDAPDFCLKVEGTARTIEPTVHDEAYGVALEAVRNAVQHAYARRIEVEIRYDPHELVLRIRDDGKGIDSDRAAIERRAGHYGLVGMNERARLLAGRLVIRSASGSGTEVELAIPATVVYGEARDTARSIGA